MVHGHEAAFLVAPLVHRELRYPEQVVLALGYQVVAVGYLQAQRAQRLIHRSVLVGHEEERVARLTVHRRDQLGHLLGAEELEEGGLDAAVRLHGYPGHALGMVGLAQLGQRVYLLAGHLGGQALGVYAAHAAACGYRALEHAEAAFAHHVAHVL